MFNRDEFDLELVRNKTNQRKLARKIGMSPNTMSSRDNGKSEFNADEIDKICDELNIEDDHLKVKIFLYKSSQNRDEVIKVR